MFLRLPASRSSRLPSVGDAIFDMLTERFCGRITDPELRDAGFVQREDQLAGWSSANRATRALHSTDPAKPARPATPATPDVPAAPLPPSIQRAPDDPAYERGDDTTDEVIDRISEARAQSRRCGSTQYAAVPPLRYSDVLSEGCGAHAEDMAERGYFDHKTPEGITPTQRLANRLPVEPDRREHRARPDVGEGSRRGQARQPRTLRKPS